MRSIHDFANGLAPGEVEVEVQTNGTFSDDVADWLAEYAHVVWFSFDGPPPLNDAERVDVAGRGCSGRVLRNIERLREAVIVGVRPTVTPRTLPLLPSLVEYFHSLGARAVAPNPQIFPVRRDAGMAVDFAGGIDLMEFAIQFERAWIVGDRLGVEVASELTFGFDEPSDYCCRACIPAPHLTLDGFVSCCDIGLWGDTPYQELIYGVYHPSDGSIEYYPDRIKTLRSRSARNLSHCADCIARFNCAGGCLGRTAHDTGTIWGQRTSFCQAVRYLASRLPRNTHSGRIFHP